MDENRTIFDAEQISKGIDNLAESIVNSGLGFAPGPGLIGVHSGGDLLVRRVEAAMGRLLGKKNYRLDKGLLDISFYRDDWSRLNQIPTLKATNIPFDVEGRQVILIDDVIFTGRTIRAAMDAIFSQGRPDCVKLAVLVDRGHREFPIQPDYVGLTLPTNRQQSVNVFLHETPGLDRATLENNKYHAPKFNRQAS